MKESIYKYTKQYNSFSGVDMVATIHIVGPDGNPAVYTLGTLQTVTTSVHMDRKPIRALGNINVKDYVMGPRTIAGTLIFAVFNKHFAYEAIDAILNDQNYNRKFSFLADELPPFDITISFANEYGCRARLAIYGIRLVNEGQVMSVNDIYTENTYQYVATDYEYLNDDNGYSSYHSNNGLKVVNSNKASVSKNQNKMNGSDLKNGLKKEKLLRDGDRDKITINCKTTNAKNVNSLGKVKIMMNPAQSTGTLVVYDTNKKPVRTININDYPNEPIYLSLRPAQYTVQYQDTLREVFAENYFYVGYDTTYKDSANVTPTILNRTKDTVSVVSNNKKHNTLVCTEKDGTEKNTKSYKLNNKKAILKNLKPGALYEIRTCDDKDKEDKSKSIAIKTLEHNNSKYDFVEDQLIKNSNLLKEDISNHKILIGLCKQEAQKNEYRISMLDSLMLVRHKLEKSPDKNSVLLSSLREIQDFVEDTSNNEQYFINSNYGNNRNRQPQLVDKIKNLVSLNDNIASVDVFEIRNNKQVFVKAFDNIDKTYELPIRPGYKHELISRGRYGELNPKLEFYALSDYEKEICYLRTNELEREKNDLIDISYKELFNYVDLNDLTVKLKNRIVYQNAKKPDMKILNAPSVLEMDDNNIYINHNNQHFLQNQNETYYVVFSNQNDLFKNNIKNKQAINNQKSSIIINKDFFVFKNDEPYYMWIEDSKGTQLSNCSSFAIDVDIDKDFVNNKIASPYIDKLISFANSKNKNDYFKDILLNLKVDEQINELNLYEKLIDKVLFYTLNTVDKMSFLYVIMQTKFDLDFCVNDNFLKDPIIIKESQLVFPTLNKEYEVIKYNISSEIDKSYKENLRPGKDFINIEYGYDYTLLFCQEHHNINIKSGFLLINNKTGQVLKYKLNVKEED